MKAFGIKILIKPEIDLVNPGGMIHIPQMGLTTMAPVRGTVVSVGSLCKDVSEGDFVLFERGKGLDIFDSETDTNLLIMRETDVLGIFDAQ